MISDGREGKSLKFCLSYRLTKLQIMTGRYPSLFFASGEERVVWRILGDHMVFEGGGGGKKETERGQSLLT